MNRDQARTLAKEFNIKGRGRMKAPELIAAVLEAQAATVKAVAKVPAGSLMVKAADFVDPADGRVTFNNDFEKSIFFKMFR